MIKNLPRKKIVFGLILLIIGYHVIFGGARILIDFKYPNGWHDNTVVAFGEELRTEIRYLNKYNGNWFIVDVRPEEQIHPERGFIATSLDENVYDYEVEMGWFYQYKMFYVYGRNGFWVIQADPFHIKLLRNQNMPSKDAQELDETIAKYNAYGNQFTVVKDESDLTVEEQNAYAHLKEKAQPRIEELKEQGLYP